MAPTKTPIRIVIAIDFGTSRSGFAYAFPGDRSVTSHWQWPGSNIPYPKTATRLLYSPERQIEAWGYEVKEKLARLRQENKANNYHSFETFKMALHEGKKRDVGDSSLVKKQGQIYKKDGSALFLVLDLIADYIKCLKDFALQDIQNQTLGELQEKEILWCLTVPAIWSNDDKQLMRQAAEKAGLISSGSEDSERLVLVSEPEAAAIHCWENIKGVAAKMRSGTCFMVVDAGGGTVDITVHEVVDEDKLDEVTKGTGGAYGSTYVDKEFERYLQDKFTIKVIRAFHDDQPVAYRELMTDWEEAKCNFDYQKNTPISIPLTHKFFKVIKKVHPELADQLEEQGQDEYIVLDPQMMKSFFQPPLDGLVSLVKEQFDQLRTKKCDFIFLVGGFAASTLLQHRIQKEFGARVEKVVVPEQPGVAIVSGAASYGLDPSIIHARRARMTYGIQTYQPFDRLRDPEDKKFTHPTIEEVKCKDRFFIFVRVGDRVDVDKTVKYMFYPLYAEQKAIEFLCYATERTEARFTDESHVHQIGKLTISRDSVVNGVDWPIELTMYFGLVEIKVEARDIKTGRIEKTNLRFSSTYFPEYVNITKER